MRRCPAAASRAPAVAAAWLALLAASPAVAAAVVAPGAAKVSPTFSLGDWELACDNTRTCRAVGYQADDVDSGESDPVALLVEREAGPGVVPRLQVMLGDAPDEASSQRPPRVSLLVDGRSQGPIELADGADSAPLSAAQAAVVLRAIVGTGKVAFEAKSGQSVRRWVLSSAGATAALLRMDDVQGRLGTPGALVRKGQKPESQALPPVPAPVVRAAPLVATRPGDAALGERMRSALKASLSDTDDCDKLTSPDNEREPITVERLSADRVLVHTACWLAAYNMGDGVWVAADQPPYAPQLVTTMATEVSAGTIEAYQKGRGIGDCGGGDQWTWDGRSFVHTSSYTTGMCKLVAPGGAWTLPTLVTAGSKTPSP